MVYTWEGRSVGLDSASCRGVTFLVSHRNNLPRFSIHFASRCSYPNTERAFKRMGSNVPSPFDKVSSLNLYSDYVEFASIK